jgi:hypothetical protein
MRKETLARLADAPKGRRFDRAHRRHSGRSVRPISFPSVIRSRHRRLIELDLDRAGGKARLRGASDRQASDRTGVEMEALVAASASASVYDMPGRRPLMTITDLGLVEKSGGRPVTFVGSRPATKTHVNVARPALGRRSDAMVAHARRRYAFLGSCATPTTAARSPLEYGRTARCPRRDEPDPRRHQSTCRRGWRHHRVGALDVGDIAVVCAASAPHRDEAFRAPADDRSREGARPDLEAGARTRQSLLGRLGGTPAARPNTRTPTRTTDSAGRAGCDYAST